MFCLLIHTKLCLSCFILCLFDLIHLFLSSHGAIAVNLVPGTKMD